MLCEHKLTNLIFKNQENSAKTQFASFSFPFFFFLLNKTLRMKCMNVMQCKSQKQKEKQKPKNNGHKGKSNEAQGSRKPRQIRDTESHQLLDEVS